MPPLIYKLVDFHKSSSQIHLRLTHPLFYMSLASIPLVPSFPFLSLLSNHVCPTTLLLSSGNNAKIKSFHFLISFWQVGIDLKIYLSNGHVVKLHSKYLSLYSFIHATFNLGERSFLLHLLVVNTETQLLILRTCDGEYSSTDGTSVLIPTWYKVQRTL